MAASNTWRLEFPSSIGGAYISLREVTFFDASNNDLSVGGTASASSVYSGYSAGAAFDKSTGTEWSTTNGGVPAWLQYVFASPVEVAKVQIAWSSDTSWCAPAGSITLRSGASQETGYLLGLESGSHTGNSTVVLAVAAMPATPPTTLVGVSPLSSPLIGHAFVAPTGILGAHTVGRLLRDFRLTGDTHGTWTDRVVFKATPSSPEQPFANALVWILRRMDGYMAWAGYSDANGYYTATGLENGVQYVAVGIDLRDAAHIPPGDPGLFKTVGAGPFTVPLT